MCLVFTRWIGRATNVSYVETVNRRQESFYTSRSCWFPCFSHEDDQDEALQALLSEEDSTRSASFPLSLTLSPVPSESQA